MIHAFIMWIKDVGQWARNQEFVYGDELVAFCFLFLVTGIVITGIITLAWFTTVGKILVGVLLAMFFIFIYCKYNDSQDTD